jgi:hypothetical protein
MRVVTESGFFDGANELRGQFLERVGPARKAPGDRFVWDYWHIAGQYTYVRTPALSVVTPSLLGRFTEALRTWGLAHLGTDRITLPWLSYYIEGCRQELHSDVQQGMWSYVYSLSPWEERRFTGGETLVASPLLLDYWATFDPERSTEGGELIERIPARFNQLTVFDSRLPHGVAAVEGTRDPLKARVALHGWFHDPEPRIDGGLDLEAVAPDFAVAADASRTDQDLLGPFRGGSTWRLGINPDGTVAQVELIVDNLVQAARHAAAPSELLQADRVRLAAMRLPASDRPSVTVLPFQY